MVLLGQIEPAVLIEVGHDADLSSVLKAQRVPPAGQWEPPGDDGIFSERFVLKPWFCLDGQNPAVDLDAGGLVLAIDMQISVAWPSTYIAVV